MHYHLVIDMSMHKRMNENNAIFFLNQELLRYVHFCYNKFDNIVNVDKIIL